MGADGIEGSMGSRCSRGIEGSMGLRGSRGIDASMGIEGIDDAKDSRGSRH